jgi:hypothetical protein
MTQHQVKRGRKKIEAIVPRTEAVLAYDASQYCVLDVGHALIKAATVDQWCAFPHALKPLSEADWTNAKLRGETDHPD